jgi:hypothetical protein
MSKPEDKVVLENGEEEAGDGRDPSGFLSEIIGAPVTVKLNSGIIFKGVCFSFISYINLTPPHDPSSSLTVYTR